MMVLSTYPCSDNIVVNSTIRWVEDQYELPDEKWIGKWSGDLEDKLGHDFSEFLDDHSATRITIWDVQVEKATCSRLLGSQMELNSRR